MKAFTITSPIYYINDLPHMGTSYTQVICDVIARYHRSRGEEVFFVTGTDENGEKIIRSAQAKNLAPQELVDQMSDQYKAAWQALNISYDRFIRTTDEDHIRAVQGMFRHLQSTGDIYKSRYEGWYCVPDETFILEAPDGKCPECGRPVDKVQRDAYFFRLSRYNDILLKLYEEHPERVQPDSRRNEVIRFIKDGLRDMCVTRDNNGWGIPAPDDPAHVIYVWFDALTNYIAAAGYPDDADRLAKFWPAALHVVGKDILVRFHATLWPAMLIGCNQEPPRQILAHGWLMMGEKKMSKSLIEQQLAQWRQDDNVSIRVTSLRPIDLIRSIQDVAGLPTEKRWVAVDTLRYFLMRDLPVGSDADFSLTRLVDRYNADLANDLGNLLNRTLSMLHRYRDGIIPEVAEGELSKVVASAVQSTALAYENLQPSDALAEIWKIISAGNHFIDDQKPWNLAKQEKTVQLANTLYSCGETCRIVAILLAPVMPSVAAEALRQLGCDPSNTAWEKTQWGRWIPGAKVNQPEPIFPRMEKHRPSEQTKRQPNNKTSHNPEEIKQQGAKPVETGPTVVNEASNKASDVITYDEFQKIKLRVATIKQAERIEGATKLLKLILDLGDEQRQIAAGIAEYYEPENLIGRQIVVLVNLAPRTIRGVQSNGMMLAADIDGRPVLLQPDSPVNPGSAIR